MAVAFDAVGPSSAGAGAAGVSGAGALTWSHTCTGSQLLLLVGVGVGGGGPDSNTVAVTYNGVSMTDCGAGKIHTNNSNLGFIQFFYLIAPATGTNTVSVNSGLSLGDVTGGSMSFTGVDQVTPIVTAHTKTAFANSSSISSTALTSATGNMVAAVAGAGSSLSSMGNTSRFVKNLNDGSGCGNLGGNTAAGAGSVTMTGTVSGTDFWAIIAVDIAAAGGAAAGPVFDQSLLRPPGMFSPVGKLTPIGDPSKTSQSYTQSLGGSVTPAGALTKQANLAKAGSVTATGALTKAVSKALAGSVTATGALAKLVSKPLAGSVTPSGAITNIKVVLKTLTGSVTPSGALTKSVAKPLAGSVTAAGALAKLVSKPLAGSVTASGTIANVKVILKTLSGSVTAAGALTKSVSKALAGSVTPSGALAKAITKPGLAGSVTPSGALVKACAKALAGTVTASGSLRKLVAKVLGGAVTAVGTISNSGGVVAPTIQLLGRVVRYRRPGTTALSRPHAIRYRRPGSD